ncbi:MAG: SMP-30/gluconolactonase/LRE family protein [Pseudomonadota bacterium]
MTSPPSEPPSAPEPAPDLAPDPAPDPRSAALPEPQRPEMRVIAPVATSLGEGPLWHPLRQDLFWVDINRRDLFACGPAGEAPRRWRFGEAAGSLAWIDRDSLLVAGETALWRFDVETAEARPVWPLEADDATTRANDGRCARDGAFWVGTMGWRHGEGAGAIHRVTRDGPRRLRGGVTVPNAIAFAPDGRTAYWTDTPAGAILRQPLDASGAPEGPAEVFAHPTRGFADGAVCDAEGHLWNAEWDGWRLTRWRPDGTVERIVEMPVQRPTCPAFGGADLRTIYVTSARTGLDDAALSAQPAAGSILAFDVEVEGLAEARFTGLDAT